MTPLSEMIPTMPDADLKTLRANAERLQVSGTAGQIASANDILPLIAAELEIRSPAKPAPKKRAPAKKKTAATTATTKKPPVTKAAVKKAPTKKAAAAAEATAG